MKMCTSCQTQYRDGDAVDQFFCVATPMTIVPVAERFHSGRDITAEHMKVSEGPVCGGSLREVGCLVCMDSGKVDIQGESFACPRGCVGFGQ